MDKKFSKKELDKLVSEKYTLGEYYFDEKEQCFFGNMDVELYVREIETDKYKACEYYYCDGYECGVDEEEQNKIIFSGSKENVRNICIEKFNTGNIFMGFPVFETNITLIFEMKDTTLYKYLPDGTLEICNY